MQEQGLSIELLIARSLHQAMETPGGVGMVKDLCTEIDKLFTAQNKPQWANIVALATMMEAMRVIAQVGIAEMQKVGKDGTN